MNQTDGYNTVILVISTTVVFTGKLNTVFVGKHGFLRTVETLTKFDVDKYGNRTRHNRRKQND